MKIKVDENLPVQIASELRYRNLDAKTVAEEGLSGGSDDQVWHAAQSEQRLLITQDLDFSQVKSYTPGTHNGLLLRLRSPSQRLLVRRVNELFDSEDVNSWAGCFVVATERKVRVRRPETR